MKDGVGVGSMHMSFIDPVMFIENDINYFMQVKVTCKEVTFPALTEFHPIEGVPQSDFTRVYGDSFISGFTDGGEFSALISIKLRDSYKRVQIRKLLSRYFSLKAASSTSDAPGLHLLDQIDGETAITVLWRGGGDFDTRSTSSWTFASLRATVAQFPRRVRASPLRTQ